MAQTSSGPVKAPPEQIKYADLLYYGAWIGIFLMAITYAVYVTGILKPLIPLHEVPNYWSMSVHDYLAQTGAPTGWGWAALLHRGDYLNFIGIAVLALMTIVCYFILISAYSKKKDTAYMVIAIAEVVVLCVAASGLLGAGGH